MSFWTSEDCSRKLIGYLDGRIDDIGIARKTAESQTDDRRKEEPAQVEQVFSGSTDCRIVANEVFAAKVGLPATQIIGQDFYDMTQGFTRINDIYAKSRADYYAQGSKDALVKASRIEHKAKLASVLLAPARKPLKILEKLADD